MWPLNEIHEWFQNDNLSPAKRSASVVLGFAGLLLLMGVLVADSNMQRRSIAVDSAAVRRDFKQRDALLDELRSNTYRANTLLRDYLLESDDAVAAQQRAELEDLRKRSNAITLQYQGMVLPNEQEGVRELRRNSDAYWKFLAPALRWSAAQRSSQGEAFLRKSVAPQRKDLIKLMNGVNKINQRDADAEEERIQTLQSRSQKRVTAISSLAFVLAVALALAVILHVRSLERDVSRRFAELQQARLDLRRLSDRLVTAQEEERRNLSRELHDELGQSMSGMLMELGRLESKLGADGSSREIFSSIRTLAEGSVARVRDLSLALRPAMLDELGLVPALRWQAREVARRTGLKVSIVADDAEDDLPDAYRTCIYRVVQEALHNCVKHSRASQVRVVIDREKDGLAISIQDSGVGFDPKHEKGLGLLGIAERVGQLGGEFHIESQPEGGAIASVYLPMPAVTPTTAEEYVA
jgi:signal transduction histidine kinase